MTSAFQSELLLPCSSQQTVMQYPKNIADCPLKGMRPCYAWKWGIFSSDYWEIYLFRELSLLYSGKTALFLGQCSVHSSIALKLLPSFYSSHLYPLYILATSILESSILFLFQQLLFSFYSRYSRHFSSFYSSYFYSLLILSTSYLFLS